MALSKKWGWKILFSVLLLSGLGWYFSSSQGISREALLETLFRFGPRALLITFFCVALQNLFMALRIWALFPSAHRISIFSVIHGVFYGQAVNTFVPARAGDFLKAVIFSKAAPQPVSPSHSQELLTAAGVIVADKLVDIVALMLLIFISGAYRVSQAQLSVPIPSSALWIALGLVTMIVLFVYFFSKQWFHQLIAWWNKFKTGLSGVLNPRRALLALAIGIAAWTCEAWALQILCGAQNFKIAFDQSVFLLFVLNLMIAVPISFANLGPFEAALVFGLGQLGAHPVISVAIAAAHHGIQMVALLSLTGLVALIRFFSSNSNNALEKTEFRVRAGDKKKAIDYFESVSGDYDGTVSKGILKIPRERERAAVIELAALNEPGASLIDVGCGAGFYSLLAKQAGMKVHSVDMSPGMVKRLEGQVDRAEVADIETINTQIKYDRVVCAGVLDFVMNPERAFLNLCDLLAPGGRLVILCPRKGPGGLLYRVEKFFFGIHINLYTKEWLSQIAETKGLKLIQYSHPLPTNMALLFSHQ